MNLDVNNRKQAFQYDKCRKPKQTSNRFYRDHTDTLTFNNILLQDIFFNFLSGGRENTPQQRDMGGGIPLVERAEGGRNTPLYPPQKKNKKTKKNPKIFKMGGVIPPVLETWSYWYTAQKKNKNKKQKKQRQKTRGFQKIQCIILSI